MEGEQCAVEGLVRKMGTANVSLRELFGNTYEGKTVLVTGHTGFKGSWLVTWLQALGANVVGYALTPPTEPSLFEALDLSTKITHIIGDVRDGEHLSAVMAKFEPQMVFHLAAQPLVRLSYHEPRATFETNVMGTINLLEAVRQSPSVRVVVNVTSDKCYENKEWDYSYRENDPLGGFDPYSASKGCAELVSSSYRNSYFNSHEGVQLATVRAGNVVGGGDWALDRIVPDCIRSLQANAAVTVRNPSAIRPWQHVLDPLAGYLLVGSLLWTQGQAYAGAWNLGPSAHSNVTVKEVVEEIIKSWGQGSWSGESDGVPKVHEARFLKLDCTRANNILRWYPVYDISETLRATTDWYKEYYRSTGKMWDYAISDIERFVQAACRQGQAWASQ